MEFGKLFFQDFLDGLFVLSYSIWFCFRKLNKSFFNRKGSNEFAQSPQRINLTFIEFFCLLSLFLVLFNLFN